MIILLVGVEKVHQYQHQINLHTVTIIAKTDRNSPKDEDEILVIKK